jgi:5-methyltetrahydropteroyltriglutamate--homocysteine methyltransferase
MEGILSDDIGSFPLPAGSARENLRAIAGKIIDETYTDAEEEAFIQAVVASFTAKRSSGLDAPTYPQIQDMIDGFYNPIERYTQSDEPYVISEEKAVIPEVEVVKVFAERQVEEGGPPINTRVCVTGPLDLYVRKISTNVDSDILINLGKSIGSFIKNALLDEPYIKTTVISLDEPSLGLNPNIVVEQDKLVEAWNKATEPVKDLDAQVHLHAPSEAEIAYQTEKINVIGIETAENQDNLKAINKKDLESYDKFLRVGIARSNVTALATEYEQATGVNPLNVHSAALLMVEAFETPSVIRKRLENAHRLFGDRIRYAGPDCGLGLWPTLDSATKLLANTVKALTDFKARK